MQKIEFLRKILEKKRIDKEIYDLSLEIEDFPIARQVLQKIDNSIHLDAFLNSSNEQIAIVSKGDLYIENISLISDSLLRGASSKFLDELLDLKILDFRRNNFKQSKSKSKKKLKLVEKQNFKNNSKWIEALKVRASDTGWIGVIIMVYGIGIGFIVHCIQRRTLTPIFYLLIPTIISLLILNIFFESLYMNTNWLTANYGGFVFFIQLIISTLLGKLAIRHDRLVALELLCDANITKKNFNSTELTEKSFALISKDISFFFKESARNLGFNFEYKKLTVFALLYDSGTEEEGIHTIEFEGRTIVLIFENKDDATKYGKSLEARDFPLPTVEMINIDELKDLCTKNNYEYRLVEENFMPKSPEDLFLIYPPQKNLGDDRNENNISEENEVQKKMNKKVKNPEIEPEVKNLTEDKISYSELKEKLANIKELLDQNLISEGDYEAMKKKILRI